MQESRILRPADTFSPMWEALAGLEFAGVGLSLVKDPEGNIVRQDLSISCEYRLLNGNGGIIPIKGIKVWMPQVSDDPSEMEVILHNFQTHVHIQTFGNSRLEEGMNLQLKSQKAEDAGEARDLSDLAIMKIKSAMRSQTFRMKASDTLRVYIRKAIQGFETLTRNVKKIEIERAINDAVGEWVSKECNQIPARMNASGGPSLNLTASAFWRYESRFFMHPDLHLDNEFIGTIIQKIWDFSSQMNVDVTKTQGGQTDIPGLRGARLVDQNGVQSLRGIHPVYAEMIPSHRLENPNRLYFLARGIQDHLEFVKPELRFPVVTDLRDYPDLQLSKAELKDLYSRMQPVMTLVMNTPFVCDHRNTEDGEEWTNWDQCAVFPAAQDKLKAYIVKTEMLSLDRFEEERDRLAAEGAEVMLRPSFNDEERSWTITPTPEEGEPDPFSKILSKLPSTNYGISKDGTPITSGMLIIKTKKISEIQHAKLNANGWKAMAHVFQQQLFAFFPKYGGLVMIDINIAARTPIGKNVVGTINFELAGSLSALHTGKQVRIDPFKEAEDLVSRERSGTFTEKILKAKKKNQHSDLPESPVCDDMLGTFLKHAEEFGMPEGQAKIFMVSDSDDAKELPVYDWYGNPTGNSVKVIEVGTGVVGISRVRRTVHTEETQSTVFTKASRNRGVSVNWFMAAGYGLATPPVRKETKEMLAGHVELLDLLQEIQNAEEEMILNQQESEAHSSENDAFWF